MISSAISPRICISRFMLALLLANSISKAFVLQELPLYRTARFDSSLNKDIPSLGEWNDLLLRDAPASYVAIHELGTNLDRYPYPVWKTPNQQKAASQQRNRRARATNIDEMSATEKEQREQPFNWN